MDLISAPRTVLFHTANSATVAARYPSHENGLYIGIPLLILIGLFFVLFGRRRTAILVGMVVGVVFFLFSLGGRLRRFPGATHYGPLLPWGYLERHISLLVNVIPVRLALIIWLAVSLVVAAGLDELLSYRKRWVGAAAFVAALGCLVPLVPTTESFVGRIIPTPSFFTTAVDLRLIPRNSIVLVVPMPDSTNSRGLAVASSSEHVLRSSRRLRAPSFRTGPYRQLLWGASDVGLIVE